MNVLILAAGYATRLYPLTLNKAKPLLEVAGKPMIEWVIEISRRCPIWRPSTWSRTTSLRTISRRGRMATPTASGIEVQDRQRRLHERLGQTRRHRRYQSGHHARENLANEDLIIVAGDNLFSEPLTDFVAKCERIQATLATYDVGDLEAIKKYSSITTRCGWRHHAVRREAGEAEEHLDRDRSLLFFARDRPACSRPISPQEIIRITRDVHPMALHPQAGKDLSDPRHWFDIGSKETLEEANRFSQRFAR